MGIRNYVLCVLFVINSIFKVSGSGVRARRESLTTHVMPDAPQNTSSALYFASRKNVISINYKLTDSGYRDFRGSYSVRGYNTVLTDTSGYIMNPGYPYEYLENCYYTWHISAKSGHLVSLSLLYLDLETNYDRLIVYDGPNTFSSRIYDYSGYNNGTKKDLTSTSNNMFIVFTSDLSNSGHGFLALFVTQGQEYGNVCNSTHKCSDDLDCLGGVCSCNMSLRYDITTRHCTEPLLHGAMCVPSINNMCATGFTCLTDRMNTTRCLCSSNQYEKLGSCYWDSDLKATVSSKSFPSAIYLNWTTMSERCDLTYTVAWESSWLSSDSGHVTSSLKGVYVTGLTPQQNYTFTITSVLPSDSFYDSKSIQTTYIVSTDGLTECKNNSQCNDTNISLASVADKEDTIKIVLIVVAAVGWFVALTALVTVIIVCLRTKQNKGSQAIEETKKQRNEEAVLALNDILSKQSSTATKNEYNPMSESTQALTEDEIYINEREVHLKKQPVLHLDTNRESNHHPTDNDNNVYDEVMSPFAK
ncbi:cubilin-like isoform X1, partial [Biomphalaria pfeifferi]